jgi:hypothetical protein
MLIINIENNVDSFEVSIIEALNRVIQVTNMGRISDKSFCYVSVFKDGTDVFADITKTGTYTFRVVKKR